MNTANLKAYAPKARTDFISAVSKQAQKYGVTSKTIHPVDITGDVCVVNGNPYPAILAPRIKRLAERVSRLGYEQTMEQVAYSWFNRLMAIRYMELHDYLGHGRRVLSHPVHPTGFQILEECTDITYGEGGQLPHLTHDKVVELKLDSTKDEELFRELLLAQCHALHQAMPFLFETIDDETELLLPENLTKTDSLIHDLITEIPEEDWQSVEIIGWLYQFYISEKKDQVIGKVVKSEDIPAATQLFTPNWIVKYMVQNTLGAQWLATYPDSPLKTQLEYYIEPAEQTDEVNEQLKTITPDSLNPEELTLIDPASGSGHILVEGYELFKAIYLERGYRMRDIAKLILEKNLFGLDIDERAAQLTGFALMMKGRADDRRLFERGLKLNVNALQNSTGFDAESIINGVNLDDYGLKAIEITKLKQLFEYATTFGSLIQVPEKLTEKLPALKELSDASGQDLFVSDALKYLKPLVLQAELLATQYDAVVANPPYMGMKFYASGLKRFVNSAYKDGKADLYGAFTLRNIDLVKSAGHVGMITIPNWMFLSTFEHLREVIYETAPIASLVHCGRGVWGSDFGSCAYILRRSMPHEINGQFLRLFEKQGSVAKNDELAERFHTFPRYSCSNAQLQNIPGSPVAYWVSDQTRYIFMNGVPLGETVDVAVGLQTGDNARFLRRWPEVSFDKAGFDFNCRPNAAASKKKWFPYNKGGEFRKWYGNLELLVNWESDGTEIIEFQLYLNSVKAASSKMGIANNSEYYFKKSITWSFTSASYFGVRHSDLGAIFDVAGSSAFPSEQNHLWVTGFLCSKQVFEFMKMLNPTLSFQAGNVRSLPILENEIQDRKSAIESVARVLIESTRTDWNAYERSWDFQSFPLLTETSETTTTLESSYTTWITQNNVTIAEMKRLEEENNRLFIDAYGLADELTPDVTIEQITLTVNPAYRYGGKLTEEELWIRFREDTMQELVSYSIGCMMGRYSLDAPGLIYANSGNIDFDVSRYPIFPADDDGIVPLTDKEWFSDDAANRIVEFMSVSWDKQNLEENLTFLAANLSPKTGEDSRDTIRRYLCDKFYKDHMQTYKKRPIYWLFSSGKQKAYQCLVYLHRYNEGTLARMRTEYVIPLTAKLSSYIDKLDSDKAASHSAAEIKKLEKEIKRLQKQQTELTEFDEKLKHFADQRIKLDLDDGVKENYGKFGDLLAEVKSIHGKKLGIVI